MQEFALYYAMFASRCLAEYAQDRNICKKKFIVS